MQESMGTDGCNAAVELDVPELQDNLDGFLDKKDDIAKSMHSQGSLVVSKKDGKHVYLECNLCGTRVKEAYKKGRGAVAKSWPNLSWIKARQHIKGEKHFNAYLTQCGGQLEVEFMDALDGKTAAHQAAVVKEEFRSRMGGHTRWTRKKLNEGAHRKHQQTEGQDVPTRATPLVPTGPVQRARAQAAHLAQQLANRLTTPNSTMVGWVGQGNARSHLEVPNRSV